jgi:hypothetical protein
VAQLVGKAAQYTHCPTRRDTHTQDAKHTKHNSITPTQLSTTTCTATLKTAIPEQQHAATGR